MEKSLKYLFLLATYALLTAGTVAAMGGSSSSSSCSASEMEEHLRSKGLLHAYPVGTAIQANTPEIPTWVILGHPVMTGEVKVVSNGEIGKIEVHRESLTEITPMAPHESRNRVFLRREELNKAQFPYAERLHERIRERMLQMAKRDLPDGTELIFEPQHWFDRRKAKVLGVVQDPLISWLPSWLPLTGTPRVEVVPSEYSLLHGKEIPSVFFTVEVDGKQMEASTSPLCNNNWVRNVLCQNEEGNRIREFPMLLLQAVDVKGNARGIFYLDCNATRRKSIATTILSLQRTSLEPRLPMELVEKIVSEYKGIDTSSPEWRAKSKEQPEKELPEEE